MIRKIDSNKFSLTILKVTTFSRIRQYGDIRNLHLRYSAALSLLPKEREEAERRLNQAARPKPTATGV